VYEYVLFDSPTDLTDHFYGGFQSLVQIPTHGVMGGCLQTPDSINWGNDNSMYCSKYAGADTVFETQIMFYYNDSAINPNSYDRAVSIFMRPHADPNHYIIASLSHDKKLEGLSYSTTNSSLTLPMVNNNWYLLTLTCPISSNFIYTVVKLDDLGPTGLGSATTVESFMLPFPDSLFANDDAIEVSITGSKGGGALYLDNFTFHGMKSADSCLTSAVRDISKENDLELIREGNELRIETNRALTGYSVYDLSGKLINQSKVPADKRIDTSTLTGGIYFFRFDGISRVCKMIIQ